MPTWLRVAAGSSPRSRSSAFALIERSQAASGSLAAGPALRGPLLTCQRARVDPEELVHRRRVLGAELLVAVVAIAAPRRVGQGLVVGDVAGRLLEVGGQAAALQHLGEDVRDPLAGQVGAADLRDRVVAVAHEDALVEAGRALALLALERPPALGDVGGELLQVEPPQRPRVARVAGEERSLDRLGQVDEREHGAVEVREVGGEEPPLLLCEFFDRVAHAAS